jgi:hypothetical protein
MTNADIKRIRKALRRVLEGGMMPLGMAAEEAGVPLAEARQAIKCDRRIGLCNPFIGCPWAAVDRADFRAWLKRKGEV